MSVDGAPEARYAVAVGRTLRFAFRHEGRQVQGTVTPRRVRFPGRMEYAIAVDDEPLEAATTQIDNWHLGGVWILSLVAVVGILAAIFVYYEVDKVIDRWIEARTATAAAACDPDGGAVPRVEAYATSSKSRPAPRYGDRATELVAGSTAGHSNWRFHHAACSA